MKNPVGENDTDLNDDVLGPGYGKMNNAVIQAIKLAAYNEGPCRKRDDYDTYRH